MIICAQTACSDHMSLQMSKNCFELMEVAMVNYNMLNFIVQDMLSAVSMET